MNREKHIKSILQKLNFELLENDEKYLLIKRKSVKFSWDILSIIGFFSIIIGIVFIFFQSSIWLVIFFILSGLFIIAFSIIPQYFQEYLKLDFDKDIGLIQQYTIPLKQKFKISDLTEVSSTVSRQLINDSYYNIYNTSIDGYTSSNKFNLLKFNLIDDEQKIKSYSNLIASFLESKMKIKE